LNHYCPGNFPGIELVLKLVKRGNFFKIFKKRLSA
jgi:hypothetical protein